LQPSAGTTGNVILDGMTNSTLIEVKRGIRSRLSVLSGVLALDNPPTHKRMLYAEY
jgi:hypothetical protein